MVSPEHLIFIDDQLPEYSFVVHPQDVEDMTYDTGVLTTQLNRPVRDRSGSNARLSLRMPDKTSSDVILAWWKTQPGRTTPGQTS